MINPVRLGVVFGLFLAIFHAAWAAMVAVGWAQVLLNFVFWAHFITPVYHVEPFELTRAATLIGFASAAGFVIGIVSGIVWNWIAGSARSFKTGG